MKFLFVRPDVPEPEAWLEVLKGAYERRHFTNFGLIEQALTAAFESDFGSDGERAVVCANATAGITASLIALGVTGKVLAPAFTFPATLSAILAARCEPVLCDVDPATGEMDLASARTAFEAYRCRAVVPVRAYGFIRDMRPVVALADEFDACTVIDAAAALGAPRIYHGPRTVEVFSLHATKSFGIGEGGVAFAAPDVAEAIKRTINFGLHPDRSFDFGINAKMTEMQAAVATAVLPRLNSILQGRAAMAARYRAFFARYPGIRVLAPENAPVWTNFPIVMPPGVDCAKLEADSAREGLQLRRYYFPSLGAGFRGDLAGVATPNAEKLSTSTICVPLYSHIDGNEFDEITGILTAVLARNGLRL